MSVTVREWTYDRKRSGGNGNTFVVRAMKEGQIQGRVLRNI